MGLPAAGPSSFLGTVEEPADECRPCFGWNVFVNDSDDELHIVRIGGVDRHVLRTDGPEAVYLSPVEGEYLPFLMRVGDDAVLIKSKGHIAADPREVATVGPVSPCASEREFCACGIRWKLVFAVEEEAERKTL